jgi:hypothetical protein
MFSTRQAARKLGITHATLSRYITARKLPEPKAVSSGGMTIHLWTEEDIERVRVLLPKIKNGRKTRYKKKPVAASTQQSAKANNKKQKKQT